MDCNEARRLIDAHTDGELDLVHELDLERHLQTCADCARRAQAVGAFRTRLRESRRFETPPNLRLQVIAGLRKEAGDVVPFETSAAGDSASPSQPPVRRPARSLADRAAWVRFTAAAASLAACIALGYAWGGARDRTDRLVEDAVGDHVRALQADHLMDVASTDQHTVKPWFAGRLDFSPPVVDLASIGFPLVGGRLERLGGHTAAALVFRRRQHIINVFVWPTDITTPAGHPRQRDGYNLTSWTAGDLSFLAVSEIPKEELAQFAEAFRTAAR
jgi:anti-sigma factor RsiW